MFRRVCRLTLPLFGLSMAIPAAAQAPWTMSAFGGFATEVDAGSLSQGSFSLGAAALRSLGGRLSLGLEVGLNRHDVFNQRTSGWTMDGTSLTLVCPSPCTATPVVAIQHRVGQTLHVGPVARFSGGDVVRPFVEAGAGIYRLSSTGSYRIVDLAGNVLNESSGSGTHKFGPGASAGLGVDWFPHGGGVGFGLAGRFRIAGTPDDDSIFGAGYATITAGVTIRLP